MGGIVLASPVLSDAGTLVASHQVTTMEVAYLQQIRPSLVWRSANLTPYLVGNLGSAKTIRYVSLRYSNAKASTTWRVRFATSEANLTAAPSYDSDTLSPGMTFYPGGADLSAWLDKFSRWYDATGKTVTWYRIDFDHSAAGDSWFQAGRLIVAEGVVFEEGVVPNPVGVLIDETVVQAEDQSGERSPRPRKKRPSLGARIVGMTKAEALGRLLPLLVDRGSSGDLVVDLHPTETVYPHAYNLCGRFEEAREVTNTFNPTWEYEIKVTAL